MRRALSSFVTVAVGAAVLVLPASAARAIDPPTVRVTPGVTAVVVGETRQLAATVANLGTTTVTWSLRSGAGTVSPTGLFTPPEQAPANPFAVVRATSTEDAGVYGEATVAIASGVPGGAFGEEIPSPAGGGQDADMGDINGDGRTDVVLFQNCCNGLSVGHLVTLTWNGTSLVRGGPGAAVSTYQENGFTGTSDHLLDIELGDLDGDGDLDVYVPFGSTQAQYWRYQVWRNDGTGTFTPDARVRATGGARSGARARLTDFDGDGKLDAVRMEWFGTLLLEKGNGDGTFQEPVTLMSTFDADSFDVGDLTGDGRPEIAVGIKGMSNNSTTIEVGINGGFGTIASEVTYNVGMAPEPRIADTNGDGWNDLVVGIGGESYTNFPPRLLSLPNLGNGTGAVGTAVQLLPWRPRTVEAVHVDADGVLDLAGYTHRGPVMLRRTGPNAFAETHAASGSVHHATFGDVTGDGRLDTFTNFDDASQFWPGSADPEVTFSVDPTVARLNAAHAATFTATLRNVPQEPKVTWTASRGTFNGATYTAPATAAPSGSPVTITATLTGTATKATREITVVNDKFQFTTLGGQDVRHVVTDPAQAAHLYAATSTGVFRSLSGGATFLQVGSTSLTGPNARQVAVVRDATDAPRLLAIFGSTLYRNALEGGDWVAVGPASAASLSVAPGSPVVWLAAGGQVHRSADAGVTWTALGQTSVTQVTAIDPTNALVVRTAAPRVSRASLVTDPAPALAMTPRELPVPNAVVYALAVHPTNRTLAYVATNDAANPLFRDAGGTGEAGSPAWAAVPTPEVVDRLSVSGAGAVIAARAGTVAFFESPDSGATWHSLNRGFSIGTTVSSVAHRTDGLELAGTSGGLYTPVEQVPPAAPAVTGGPSGTTGPNGSFAFTFDTVADALSYVCALDNAGWSACSSPRTYSGPLATGTHTFSVAAVDANGNESAVSTRSWTVDATPPPVPTILSGPAGLVRSTTAAFTFELTGDAAGATCALDNATPVSCASGVSYSSLSQGNHTFAVRSVDAAGNASAAATRAWTVDTMPPSFPAFWSLPQPVSQSSGAFFQWSSDQTATYACTLDGSPVTCSSSSASLAGLTEGQHTFRVVASDAAGNTSANQYTWHVDLTNPDAPVITVKPDLSTAATEAHFEFASPSTDVSYYWCFLNGTAEYCYGDKHYASLAPGTYTFGVKAFDHSGRQSAATEYAWTVVLAAPQITSGPQGLVASRAATFAWTTADGSTNACSLDGATPVPCTSGWMLEGLADGPHTFAVTATLNGVTSQAATREWTVDATAPDAPVLTAVPPLRTKSGDATFSWVAEPGLTYTCKVDGQPVDCSGGTYAATGVAQGTHHFLLTARDAALNESTAPYSWTVDQTAPVVSLVTKPAARTSSTSAFLEFGAGAPDLHHYTCTVDGVAAGCTSPVTLSSLGDGAHTFSVVAVDDLGNAGDAAAWAWTVDTEGPAVALTSAPATPTRSEAATFEFSSAAEDLDDFVCTVDGVTQPCASPFDLSSLTPGTHTFSVVATDDLRNIGDPASHTWTVDLTAPVATIGTPATVLNPSHTVTFDEPVTGVSAATVRLLVTGTTTAVPSAVSCRTAAGAVVACNAATVQRAVLAPAVPLTPGQLYTITVSSGVTDAAGNAAAPASRAYRASTSEQETSLGAKQAWRRLPWTGAQGGSFHVAHVRNATASYAFTGTSVTWYGVRGPSYGLADVYVDNVLKASKVNFYSTSTGALTRTISGLSNAPHTLRIVVRGERGSTAGKGTDVAVDAFKVGTAVVATPPVTFAWARNAASAASGGAYMLEDTVGATYTVTFRGRGIDWVTMLGPNMGKATVHIDGVSKGTFDNWASATKYQQVRRFGGLTDKVHTMTITVLGQRRSGATGSYVAVDRLGILP